MTRIQENNSILLQNASKNEAGSTDNEKYPSELHVVKLEFIFYIFSLLPPFYYFFYCFFLIYIYICHPTIVPFRSLSMLNEGWEG